MKIGILKERKRDERRVALRPDQVYTLYQMGHQVYVETGAGGYAGYSDEQYAHGASVTIREEIYQKCLLLVKVKRPEPEEVPFLRPGHVLFTFLHFDENLPPEGIRTIVDTGVTGIAFEWVEEQGKFPLLQPMSEITGGIFAHKAMHFLLEHAGIAGGKTAPNLPNPQAMIIGLGHIGTNAMHVLLHNGFDIVLVDKHPDTVDQRAAKYIDPAFWSLAKPAVKILHLREEAPEPCVEAIRNELPATSILICSAVRRPTFPKSKCKYLVDRRGVASMSRNSVICEATAMDRDLIETAVSSESLSEHYVEEGVIHYNCDHIPSLSARTATESLSSALFSYVVELAEGFETDVNRYPALYKGTMCHHGMVTHRYSAEKKGLRWTELQELLTPALAVSETVSTAKMLTEV